MLFDFKLDDFYVWRGNCQAYAAAKTLVLDPSPTGFPIYLNGPAGLGKTSLLMGISTGIRERYSDIPMRYETGIGFAGLLTEAIQAGRVPDWRREMSAARVLILDDFEGLLHSIQAQEELLRVVEATLSKGVVVVCGNLDLEDARGMLPGLRECLRAGQVYELAHPSTDFRLDDQSPCAGRDGWGFLKGIERMPPCPLAHSDRYHLCWRK